jgi:hypothetical protein
MATDETNGTPQMPADDNDFEVVDNFNINHDPEDLIRYQGQYVAWSRDGHKVLFASPDPYKLFELVDAAGLQSDDYVVGGIPKPNVVFLGGMFGFEANWGP